MAEQIDKSFELFIRLTLSYAFVPILLSCHDLHWKTYMCKIAWTFFFSFFFFYSHHVKRIIKKKSAHNILRFCFESNGEKNMSTRFPSNISCQDDVSFDIIITGMLHHWWVSGVLLDRDFEYKISSKIT